MNRTIAIACSLILAATAGRVAASDDLGESAGYLAGSVTSGGSYPWFPLSEEGPDGTDCIQSGVPFAAGELSTAELTLTGPGVLTFQWYVDSKANDGWLTCGIRNSATFSEVGGITGSGAGWQRVEMFIPQGATKVSWTYSKVSSDYEALLDDAGRVAGIDFDPLPTAAQSFENWKLAKGVSGLGQMAPNGLRYDTCWAMGLEPGQPVPAGLNIPVFIGQEVRYRVRYSRSATVLLRALSSRDLAQWTMRGSRSRLVSGSITSSTVDFDYFLPKADRGFFDSKCPPQVTPPAGYAYVPPGDFLMCSPPGEMGREATENYQHPVTLTQGFFLKQYETTYQEWIDTRTWGRANGYTNLGSKSLATGSEDMGDAGGRLLGPAQDPVPGSGPSLNGEPTQPVTNVSWWEALKWLNAKSERDGLNPCYYIRLKPALGGAVVVLKAQSAEYIGESVAAQSDFICKWEHNGYRLPTEAEWEFACRAGTTSALNNGLEITNTSDQSSPVLDANVDPVAWYYANGAASHPVGQKQPNGFGLYDMHGNAAEWCWDLVDDTLMTQFAKDSVTDPRGQTERGIYRAIRGGSWRNTGKRVRSAYRDRQIITLQGGFQVGFRIARNAE